MKKNDEQSQVKSSNTNSGTTGAKSEKSKSSVKVSKTATKDKKAEKTIKEEGDFKSMSKSQVPSAPSKTSQGDLQSSDNQRMITNLNYIGSKNKDFNDLMNEVAGGLRLIRLPFSKSILEKRKPWDLRLIVKASFQS